MHIEFDKTEKSYLMMNKLFSVAICFFCLFKKISKEWRMLDKKKTLKHPNSNKILKFIFCLN